MALVIRGKTCCRLCGRVHAPDDELELFPPGLFEASDPASEVDDAAVHRECLLRQPYAAHAVDVRQAYIDRFR